MPNVYIENYYNRAVLSVAPVIMNGLLHQNRYIFVFNQQRITFDNSNKITLICKHAIMKSAFEIQVINSPRRVIFLCFFLNLPNIYTNTQN